MATPITAQGIRDYATSKGYKPNADGTYSVPTDADGLRIFAHAQDQGFDPANVAAAFGWSADDTQKWIEAQGLPAISAGQSRSGSTATPQEIRNYAKSQGYAPDASGRYAVNNDEEALRIYNHAKAKGYTPAQLDAAFGWNAGDAQRWISSQGLPELYAQATPSRSAGIVSNAMTSDAGPPATAGYGDTYSGVLGNYQAPTGYPEWATDDYLKSIWDAGYTSSDGGQTFLPRTGLANGAEAAAQEVDAFLRAEYDKAVATGDPAAIEEFNAKYQQAKQVFNENYVVDLSNKNFRPLSANERQGAAGSAYDQLSKVNGISLMGLDPSKIPSFAQLTGVDDGSKMDFNQAMADMASARPEALDISGGGYDTFKKAVDDYRMHGGVLTERPGLDMSKYTALLSQADAARGGDIGKMMISSGKKVDSGLINSAASDYFKDNIQKVTIKNKPMEYSGPAAGNSIPANFASGASGKVEPTAPLQTPVLARRTGIVGGRM